MYIPGFSNMLMQRMARGGSTSRFADADGFMYDPEMVFQPEDMGGPAYVDFAPYAEPFPAEPMPAYAAPQDDFLARIQQAEAMAQAEAPVYTPDTGALNMIFQPENMGGPAYADMMPGALPEQVSMLPFAPEAPAPQIPQPSMPQPSGLGARQDFIDEREMYMGAMPDRFSGAEAASNALANAPQRDPVTGLLLNAQGEQGFQFMTDRGRQAGYGKGNTGFITADPNAQYRMWDERGKNRIVSEGAGVEALQNIYNTANQFNQEQGKKANWGIERLNPTTGQWERIAENDPAKNIVGKIADVALPTIGAIVAGPLGAAAGSAVSGVAQGRAIEDIALRAAIAGGATYAGGELFGPVAGGAGGAKAGSAASSLAGSTLGAGTMGAVGAQLAGVGAPIIVTNAAGSALGSALGSAAGSALGSAASGALAPSPSPLQQQPVEITPEGEMVLTAPPQVGGALPVASAGASVMAQAGLDAAQKAMERQAEQERENEIIVETQRPSLPSGFDPGPLGAVLPNIPLKPVFTPDLSPEIVVEADREPLPSGFDPGPLGAVLPNIPLKPVSTPDLSPEIVVEGEREPLPSGFDPGPLSAVLPNLIPTPVRTPDLSPEIVVTGDRQPTSFDDTPTLPLISSIIPTPVQTPDFGNEIVVEADREPLPSGFDPGPIAPVLPNFVPPSVDVPNPADKGVLDQLKDRLGNLDAADYLRLAGVLLPLLDGGGGGRRGALSTIPSGMFGRSSVFGGSLPRATLPGASTGFAPRAPSTLGPQTTQDYYRYGYGPAQSFFDYVPQGQPNTSRAFTGYEQAQAREDQGFYLGGMAGGGDMSGMSDNSFAVNGPGTGRSDEIPAMLSDGEYVIDAETVALLGDGSSKAGANRLDQFRINVRKDKGRNLAKGEFSVNAKHPEHYLKGGRA
jgi:hypothetical protein